MGVGKMVGFFERLGRGWYLTKVSIKLLREEKQLLVLPLVSGITLGAVALSFIIGMFGLMFWTNAVTSQGALGNVLLVVMGFLFYVVTYFVGIYFNCALVHCATIKLQGGHPTLGDGFGKANENLKLIFMWAVTAATVGMIIRAIQQRLGILGKIIGVIAGIAWSIAIYFVVPVIIYERLGPWAAVKRSTQIMKATWGEAMGGTFGMGIVFGLLALLGIPLILVGIYLAVVTANFWIALAFVIGTIIYWLMLAIFASAAEGILLAALYRYAVTGQVSPGYEAAMYQNPWGAAAYYQPPPPTRPAY
jgi:hypothetical protein